MTPYQQYIYKSRYARLLHDKERREEWPETVDRYISFFKARLPDADIPWGTLHKAILNFDVMPSMRALMTAGAALDKDNVAGYNCAYVEVDHPRVFDEIMYILMCGTGVGFSVERRVVEQLPIINEEFKDNGETIVVGDSKLGWATSFRTLIRNLYEGRVSRWDISGVRPAGTPLRTFGGRASGPEPLEDLFNFTVRLFRQAAGRRLSSIEVHDLVCKIAEVVVCGGVRRSALLSLSNLTDEQMRNAKTGDWYHAEPQRALSNNSVAYTSHPDMGIFISEWLALYRSKSGERGIFNRQAAKEMVPDRRDDDWNFGTNPCSEIVLRTRQFCNLTEVIVREDDTKQSLKAKISVATILGTLQSTLTDFRYISATWAKNTQEERLLGVSLTGIVDSPLLRNPTPELLEGLRSYAIMVNKKYSSILGIPQSAAITCVKPSGTVSQLCGTSSGIHPRYSPYYLRRVRCDINDPLAVALKDQGIHHELSRNNNRELIFTFPTRSPKNTPCVADTSAKAQLELWKLYALHWCEHKPSCTVYVKENEWLDVAAWVWENWKIVNGISFFPMDDHIYPQAPYEEITKDEYEKRMKSFPKELDLNIVEKIDVTTASQELACVGGACDL